MLCPIRGIAQLKQIMALLKNNYDSAYISDHSKEITVRTFISTINITYKIGDDKYADRLTYKPNENFSIGAGFNYKFLGLNLSVKMPGRNDDDIKFGKTTHLDLTSFVYLRKITIDLYGEFYKGYYLSNPALIQNWKKEDGYYKRPDLRTISIGTNIVYIFNNKRFSYRAAYMQNEYQKKSSGSFLLGAGIHYQLSTADSAIIPAHLIYENFWENKNFRRSSTDGISVSAGYAHTFIINKHFFVTASFLPGVGFDYSKLKGPVISSSGLTLLFNSNLRFAAGYNSERYFAGIYFINFLTHENALIPSGWQEYQTGNFHLAFAMRFKTRKLF